MTGQTTNKIKPFVTKTWREKGRIFSAFYSWLAEKIHPALSPAVLSIYLPPKISYVIWWFWVSIAMKTTFFVNWSAFRVSNLNKQPWSRLSCNFKKSSFLDAWDISSKMGLWSMNVRCNKWAIMFPNRGLEPMPTWNGWSQSIYEDIEQFLIRLRLFMNRWLKIFINEVPFKITHYRVNWMFKVWKVECG